MLDFTLSTYRYLLTTLQEAGYTFLTYEAYCVPEPKPNQLIILRHDVDKKPENSLTIARIEHSLGIQASYYFRIGKESNSPKIIRQIVELGHEVGYHYEDMSIAHGDIDAAYTHFEESLSYFRRFYPVRTICMHGAPTSQWDGRDLWQKYDYHTLGIVGEPYLDCNYSELFYLTDTGRCWDGFHFSVRDKIPVYQDQWMKAGLTYHSTQDICKAVRKKRFPTAVMITTHPQRWTDRTAAWVRELVWQNTKNIVKRALIYAKTNNH